MKPEILDAHINTPCYKCGKSIYIITKERDKDGYQKAICKNCSFVMMKFSDNGTSIDIQLPNIPIIKSQK